MQDRVYLKQNSQNIELSDKIVMQAKYYKKFEKFKYKTDFFLS